MASDQSNGEATTLDLVVVRNPDSEGSQAYRSVRETLRHARSDSPIRSILLADAGSRDHVGEASANISASFALNGNPTVLVDIDAGNPVVHDLLGVPAGPGLIDWLSSSKGTDDPHPQPFSTAIQHLTVFPPGTRETGTTRTSLADLLTDEACERLIGQLGASAGYVIFHGSVTPVTSQALTVAAKVDAVVLLVRSGTTKRTDAQRAKESLQRVGANLLGVVLTEGS
jgi:Mrp family chromosome partitioning ATPase